MTEIALGTRAHVKSAQRNGRGRRYVPSFSISVAGHAKPTQGLESRAYSNSHDRIREAFLISLSVKDRAADQNGLQSQASKAAPSQRGNTAFNFVVSLSSLESIRYNILRALQQLKTKNQFNGKWLEQPLQPGDIDERDQVPGGDGFILSFTARDNRSEEMIGWIRVLPEFDSPLLEELAQRNGIDADKAYIVKFDRGKGNPMSFRSLHKAIVDACPPELLVAR